MNWWIVSTVFLGAWVFVDVVKWVQRMHKTGSSVYRELNEAMQNRVEPLKGPPIAPLSPPRSKPQCSCSCEDCSPVHR